MALDDVEHVEVVGLIKELALYAAAGGAPHNLIVTAEGWLQEKHPPPGAYLAALRLLGATDGVTAAYERAVRLSEELAAE